VKVEVSVIIPAYNRAHCLARALGSIRQQGLASCEILLGDDASTDETIAVARREWPEVRVFSLPENRGAAAARNAALPHAQGQWIAFLDSDDEWLPGKLAAQLSYLRDHPGVGVCACGHELILRDGSGSRLFPGHNPADWPRALARAQSFHGASTPVIRADVLARVGGQDESLRVLEDWDWMLRAAACTPIHVLPEIHTRIYENQPSQGCFTREATVRFLAKHRAEFSRYGWKEHREIESQQWENAARNAFLHRENGIGLQLLSRSLLLAPWRNPLSAAAFPVAAWDMLTRRADLPRLLHRRANRPLP
jgi:glycosyltransferase involved in cell wall biosynthesis